MRRPDPAHGAHGGRGLKKSLQGLLSVIIIYVTWQGKVTFELKKGKGFFPDVGK